MDRYIKKYDSSSVLKADVDGRVLKKPYVALINDTSLDFNSLTPSSLDVTPFWVEPDNEYSSVTVSLKVRPYNQTIWYSSDASEWSEYTSSAETITITSRMYFKGLLDGNIYTNLVTADNYYKIGGNIYSLVIGDDFLNQDYTFTSNTDCTCYMFKQDSYLKDASQLSADFVYNQTQKMTFLPYTFSACTALIAAPAYVRPPKQFKDSGNSFRGCTNLNTAPEYVIEDLTQLPSLQSTFSGCTSLNYIKCLAKGDNLSAGNNWVAGVAATGTFVKHKDSTWVSGNNGIPSGWTVIDAE